MAPSHTSCVVSELATQKKERKGGRRRRRLDSWERLGSAFVAPPLSKYSKLFIPPPAFLSSGTLFVPSHFIQPWRRRSGGGGRRLLSEPLSKQCGEKKGACHLYSVPRRTCLFFFFLSLFELQAVELSREFDVRKAELIALSQRGGPPITRTLPAMLYGDY